jgi:acyl-coenzyme A synthetase/AMP-(fatty) acid ligase
MAVMLAIVIFLVLCMTSGGIGMLSCCNQVANALECLGLQQGDAITIDMPMTMYAITAYLTIILVGFVVVLITDNFVPNEIRIHIQISKAKAIFTQVNSTFVGFKRHHYV